MRAAGRSLAVLIGNYVLCRRISLIYRGMSFNTVIPYSNTMIHAVRVFKQYYIRTLTV